MVTASRNRYVLAQWFADRGFVVVSVDGRGTPDRGRAWERALSRQVGPVPLEDQVEGLRALGAQFPELDLSRVGIFGWSYGGYVAAYAVMRRPDVFHAAVAGAPVVDWRDYDTHYTERYLGLPDRDRAAYDRNSLLTYAASLGRPLLLIHGTADDNVYFTHAARLSDALFRAGRPFEFLPLVGLTHMVPDPALVSRLNERMAAHFERALGVTR
jgi:dipeptidyl-peptidase-4